MIDDGVSSISGSDSDTEGREERNALSREPKTLFEEPSQGGKFSIWNCVLFQDTPGALQGPMPPSSERHAQLRSIATEHSTWTVILSSGGHFAAGIFDMRSGADKCPLIRAVNVSRTGEWPVALEHKTVHRYVTRAGQGGRQTNQDRSGKVASSAGSALRRYNESALTRDVAATLTGWAPRLAAADAVFVNAPGASAAPVAEGLAAAGVGRRDARIRRVPFPTARPTFRELRRAVLRLAAAEEGTGAAAAAAAAPAAAAGAVECAAAAAATSAAPVGQAAAGGGGGGIWAEPAEEVSAEALAEAKAKAAKAEKRARQRAREKVKKAAAAAAKKEAEREAAAAAEDPEEVARALQEVEAAMAARKKAAAKKGPAKGSEAGGVSRGADASVAARRERMAAAAEARARALQAATSQQQLW